MWHLISVCTVCICFSYRFPGINGLRVLPESHWSCKRSPEIYFVSNTMYMYASLGLSDHANADPCIDESGFSHDILLHMISLQPMLPHCSRASLPKPDYRCSVHISFSICLTPRKMQFCPDMAKIVDMDVKPKHNPLTERNNFESTKDGV